MNTILATTTVYCRATHRLDRGKDFVRQRRAQLLEPPLHRIKLRAARRQQERLGRPDDRAAGVAAGPVADQHDLIGRVGLNFLNRYYIRNFEIYHKYNKNRDSACVQNPYLCSPGRIRTYNPAVTLIPILSYRSGLSHQLCTESCRALVRFYWSGSSTSSLCTFLPTLDQ